MSIEEITQELETANASLSTVTAELEAAKAIIAAQKTELETAQNAAKDTLANLETANAENTELSAELRRRQAAPHQTARRNLQPRHRLKSITLRSPEKSVLHFSKRTRRLCSPKQGRRTNNNNTHNKTSWLTHSQPTS
jgi:septal ring factor EnvC (AmiA/AmiB activator)